MDGQPVWLASVSTRSADDKIVTTGDLNRRQMRNALRAAREVLYGVGDPDVERAFRMNVTVCIHRALTAQEKRQIPPEWLTATGVDLAGGCIEILYEKGCTTKPSCAPCLDPGRQIIDPAQPKLWVPIDCGLCEPCRARLALEIPVQ